MRKMNFCKNMVVGIVAALIAARVLWVNLEYSRNFRFVNVPIEETQYMAECGLDVCVEEMNVYTDVSDLNYSETALNEKGQDRMPFTVLQAWDKTGSPYYLIAVRVSFHNKSQEDATALLLQYELYGSDWRQSPQIIFEEQVGAMDGHLITLEPEETRTVQLLFRASDEKYWHTAYRDAGEGRIYLSYLGDHVRYCFSLSDEL